MHRTDSADVAHLQKQNTFFQSKFFNRSVTYENATTLVFGEEGCIAVHTERCIKSCLNPTTFTANQA
jgi:hypothetical protein